MRDVVSSSGTELDHIVYDSFGNILTETNASNGDRFKFAGMEWDSATDEYFDHARMLAPSIGRFDSLDPDSFDSGEVDLYRYATNDPLSAVDPTGEDQISQMVGQTAAMGTQIAAQQGDQNGTTAPASNQGGSLSNPSPGNLVNRDYFPGLPTSIGSTPPNPFNRNYFPVPPEPLSPYWLVAPHVPMPTMPRLGNQPNPFSTPSLDNFWLFGGGWQNSIEVSTLAGAKAFQEYTFRTTNSGNPSAVGSFSLSHPQMPSEWLSHILGYAGSTLSDMVTQMGMPDWSSPVPGVNVSSPDWELGEGMTGTISVGIPSKGHLPTGTSATITLPLPSHGWIKTPSLTDPQD